MGVRPTKVVAFLFECPIPTQYPSPYALQVAAAKKKATRTTTENAEEVTPKDIKDQLKERMADLLKMAETARTNSLKLSNVEFAKELGQQLLDHAISVEKLYKAIQHMQGQSPTEKSIKLWLSKIDDKQSTGDKMKARYGVCGVPVFLQTTNAKYVLMRPDYSIVLQ